MTHEEWRPWRSGDYEVSSMGNVRRARPGRRTWVGRPLKRTLMKIGYLKVAPVVDGKNEYTYVHVMVAECFIGPREGGMEVNHKDGNKANPEASNLEYVSHRENMEHASKAGLMQSGESHYAAKLSNADVDSMRVRFDGGDSVGDIASDFGIANSTASNIVNRRSRM